MVCIYIHIIFYYYVYTILSILDGWFHFAQVIKYNLLLFFDVLSLNFKLLLDLLRSHLFLLCLLLIFHLDTYTKINTNNCYNVQCFATWQPH